MFVNKYVKRTKPYPLVTHLAWQHADDSEVLKLDWNEATIDPSPMVKQALVDLANSGRINWYPDVNNNKLRQAIAEYAELPMGNVQYYASSDALHEYIVRAFIEPGDRIMIVSPTYDNFRASAESLGGLIDYFYLDEDFKLDFQAFYDQLRVYEPKLVYICNPNNPTGTLFSANDLSKLLLDFRNTLFLIDEAYYEFSGTTCSGLVKENENILISRTFSKAFAMASLRIGYVIASETNVAFLDRIRNPKNISAFAQVAAIAALKDYAYTSAYVGHVRLTRDYFFKKINEIGKGKLLAFPSGGNFTLIRIDQSLKASLISFLESHKIFIRNYGHVRGMEDFVRITIGTQGQMERVIKVTQEFIKGLGS